MDNFELAEKWSKANMNYNYAMREIMEEYHKQLSSVIKYGECYMLGNKVFVEDGEREFTLYLDENGMRYIENDCSEPHDIPCEYSLPTIDEIIKECEFEKEEK